MRAEPHTIRKGGPQARQTPGRAARVVVVAGAVPIPEQSLRSRGSRASGVLSHGSLRRRTGFKRSSDNSGLTAARLRRRPEPLQTPKGAACHGHYVTPGLRPLSTDISGVRVSARRVPACAGTAFFPPRDGQPPWRGPALLNAGTGLNSSELQAWPSGASSLRPLGSPTVAPGFPGQSGLVSQKHI